MENKNKLSRRRFAQLVAFGSGSIYLLQRCSRSISKWRFFTDSEAQLMDAIADQIIPPDAWPGGKETGVTNFVEIKTI